MKVSIQYDMYYNRTLLKCLTNVTILITLCTPIIIIDNKHNTCSVFQGFKSSNQNDS